MFFPSASLIAEQVASSCDLHKVWQTLGKFVLTVLVGLVLQALVVLPAVYSLVVRRNPWRVLSGMVVSAVSIGTVFHMRSLGPPTSVNR